MSHRYPDELLVILDQAQEIVGEEFDLRDLVWEMFCDVLYTVQMAAETYLSTDYADKVTQEVEDYLTNQYGDD